MAIMHGNPPAAPTSGIDLEALFRAALAGISVAAYARGIALSGHVDPGLPTRLDGDAEALEAALRRGLTRTVSAPATQAISLGFWRGRPGEAPVMLEVARSVAAQAAPSTGLDALWTLPEAGGLGAPQPHPKEGGIESVLIPLPQTPQWSAPRIGAAWGGAFRGRRLLIAAKQILDGGRWTNSLAALGMTVADAADAETAIARAEEARASGRVPDLLVLDAALLGADAAQVARHFRADPDLAAALIVLAGEDPDPSGAAADANGKALYDAVLRPPMPWRRLFDTLSDLIRAGDPAPVPRPQAARAAPRLPDLTGKRILIAEDVETNQVLLRAMLEPTGAEVEVLDDGAALVARHTEAPADLVLLDLQMPGMGGLAAVRRIRAMGGAPGRVRAVALTAYARAADRRTALAAGMDGYLPKPVVIGEFYELLDELLD